MATYEGLEAGKLIGTAFGAVEGIKNTTVRTGAKGKQPLSEIKIDPTTVFQGSLCDFTPAGGEVDTKIVDLDSVSVNLKFCKDTLSNDYAAYQLSAGADGGFTPEAQGIIINEILGKLAIARETALFTALNAEAKADSDVVKVTIIPGNLLDATKVIAEIGKVYKARPASVAGSLEIKIYVSHAVKDTYLEAVADAHNMVAINSDVASRFLGAQLVGVAMADDLVIVSPKSNMFYITDLMTDGNSVEVLDMKPMDGSNQIRFALYMQDKLSYGKAENIVIGDHA